MRFFIAVCALVMMLALVDIYAQKTSGSSKPSSSSSRPSSSSSRPSSSSGSKYSSPSSSKPSSSSSKPSTPSSSGPKYSSPSTSSKPPSASTPKYSSPSTSTGSKSTTTSGNTSKYSSPSTPNTSTVSGNSSKPKTVENDFSRANKQEASKKYVAQQAATAPPKSSYTTQTGQTVKIDTKDPRIQTIRTKPSTYYQPEARQQRYETHFHHYHYPQSYNYYYSQPYYYVGGGYSSVFWYMMLSWDADRRAQWLYHNQDRIDRNAYNEGVRDANVAARLRALEQQNVRRDPNYVDPEFRENPVDMYDQEYIEAAYNPEIAPMPVQVNRTSSSDVSRGIWSFLFWTTIILGIIGLLAWLLIEIRIGR